MRFLITHHLDDRTHEHWTPTDSTREAMGELIAQMGEEGVLLTAEGLRPSAEGPGIRLRFTSDGAPHTVADGPFAEAEELLGGFVMVRVPSREEAAEWAERYGSIVSGQVGDVSIEVRKVSEVADVDPGVTTEPAVHIVDHSSVLTGSGTGYFEGREHGSRVSVITVNTDQAGAGPALHRHPYDETFFLHSGEAEFVVGERTFPAHGGQIIVAPADTAHRFSNTGTERLEMTNIHASDHFVTEWLDA